MTKNLAIIGTEKIEKIILLYICDQEIFGMGHWVWSKLLVLSQFTLFYDSLFLFQNGYNSCFCSPLGVSRI